MLTQGCGPAAVLLCTGLTMAAIAGPARAQQPAATVTIDATIVDAKGQPLPGLGADAIRVFVDDRPRTVSAVEFVSPGTAETPRTLHIVVDQTSVFPGAEKALADVVSALLDRLGPHDRVGLVALPAPGPTIAPAADTAAVEAALAKLTGRRSPELTNFGMGVGEALAIAEGDTFALTAVADRECRGFGNAPSARDSPVAAGGPAIANPRQECLRRIGRNIEVMVPQALRASAPVYQGLLELLSSLRGIAGSKAVVLVTGGLAVSRGEDAFVEAAVRAAAAEATVHAILVEPGASAGSLRLVPANPANERRSLDRRLDELTAASRGTSHVTASGVAEVVDRVMGDLSGFYRVTVAAEPAAEAAPAAGGRGRRATGRLRIEAGRGTTVRARPFLVPPTPRARATRTPEERLADALRGGAGMRRDLPMEAAGYLLLGGGGTVTLLVAGHVDLPDTTAEDGPPVISLSYAVFDDRQQPVATGAMPPAGEARGTPLRVPFTGGLDGLQPGRYTLRVAATDGAARVGSIERTLELRPARAGDLVTSDVLIGRITERQVSPIAGVAAPDDRVGLQVDLMGPSAPAVAVRFLVLDRGGSAPVLTLPGTIEVLRKADGPTPALASATAVLAPRLLPAGEYDVRAEVVADGRTVGQVTRALSIKGVAVAGGAAAPMLSAALVEQVWGLAPRFSREVMTSPALLGPALGTLAAQARGPRARAAIEAATAGTVTVADEALRREDALAAAFLSGVARFRAGDLEAAAREFREAVRVSSDFFPAAVFLGACYAAGGKDREAAGAWQTALIAEPPGPAVHTLLIEALLRVRDAEGAAGFVDEVRARWPEATAELALAEALIALVNGRRDEGLARLDALASPGPAALFVAMSVLYEGQVSGRPVEAPAADRTRFERYAARYAAAGGTEQALIARWLSSWR